MTEKHAEEINGLLFYRKIYGLLTTIQCGTTLKLLTADNTKLAYMFSKNICES